MRRVRIPPVSPNPPVSRHRGERGGRLLLPPERHKDPLPSLYLPPRPNLPADGEGSEGGVVSGRRDGQNYGEQLERDRALERQRHRFRRCHQLGVSPLTFYRAPTHRTMHYIDLDRA